MARYSPQLHIPVASAPEDPGVSHTHAILIQQPDSTWPLIDQNSTNGTTVNGVEDPIDPFVPVPLKDGDRVHVGLWTTITIRRDRRRPRLLRRRVQTRQVGAGTAGRLRRGVPLAEADGAAEGGEFEAVATTRTP
ncbi:FHA domain-containing protein [Streptomyces mirabilis]